VIEPLTPLAHFRRVMAIARRQWWLIGLVLVLALGAATFRIERADPVYESSMKVVVGQGRALFGPSVSFAIQPFTETMSDLLQSEVVAQETITRLRLQMKPADLLSDLHVTSGADTSVLQVSYHSHSVRRGTLILGMVGSVFTELIDRKFAGSPRTTAPAQGLAPDSAEPVTATVFDPAHPVAGRVSPKTKLILAIAAGLGLLGGILLALLRDTLARRIRSPAEAQAALDLDVVGTMPAAAFEIAPAQLSVVHTKVATQVTRSVSLLAASLRYAGALDEQGVILVTSAAPAEGKTTVAAHLAAELARSGKRVVAIEADLHNPSLHKLLSVEPGRAGLSDVLSDEADLATTLVRATGRLDEALVPAAAGAASSWDAPEGPLFLAAGTPHPDPARLFLLGRFADLTARLRLRADFVVVDTPPLLLASETYPLVQLADLVLVVVREGATKEDQARAVADKLKSLHVQAAAIVVTASTSAKRDGYTYGYGRYGDTG
jgi:succinoglycan biosynthesis transport protein ExoP